MLEPSVRKPAKPHACLAQVFVIPAKAGIHDFAARIEMLIDSRLRERDE